MEYKLEEPVQVTIKRARFMYILMIVGIIYSFLLTAGASWAVWTLHDRLEETCDARQTSRTAYRLILSRDEDWDQQDQELLDANLPAKVTC